MENYHPYTELRLCKSKVSMNDIQRALSRNIFQETETLIESNNSLINEINYLNTLKSESRKKNIVCDGLNLRIANYKRYIEQIEQQISNRHSIRRKVLYAVLWTFVIAVLAAFLFWIWSNEKN